MQRVAVLVFVAACWTSSQPPVQPASDPSDDCSGALTGTARIADGDTLSNVVVVVPGVTAAVSDASGHFRLSKLPSGPLDVEARWADRSWKFQATVRPRRTGVLEIEIPGSDIPAMPVEPRTPEAPPQELVPLCASYVTTPRHGRCLQQVVDCNPAH
jgi:hypothetical protein